MAGRSGGIVRIGTSGWHYRHWKGCFYPKGLATTQWLGWYAQHFSCVELNNSFYKLPTDSAVRGWVEHTPDGFVFAVKASRLMTHLKKLNRCEETLSAFFNVIDGFGEKLGPILFQLPPRWRADPERLARFLDLLPTKYTCAFEFRNPDWHREEVYQLLAAHNAGFCLFELNGLCSPEQLTSDTVYVRLHGPSDAYCGDYSPETLEAWKQKLKIWHDQGLGVYLFFDNDQAGYAVKNALTLQRLNQANVE